MGKIKNIPDILYHYTTMETLFAILSGLQQPGEDAQSNELSLYTFILRATQADYLNDPSEYYYYSDMLLDFLKSKTSSGEFNAKDYMLLKREIRRQDNLFLPPCVLSLSAHEDDLNMWRCYGGDGKGVAIGFDALKLSEALKEQNEEYELTPCDYKTPEPLERLFRINKIRRSIQREKDKSSIANSFTQEIRQGRLTYKHAAYSGEKEWRLYLHSSHASDYEFYVKNGIIRPYRELQLPMSVIKGIYLGPTTYPELSVLSLGMLLKKKLNTHAKKIDIGESDIPYENF